jgi:hypothetical protein
MWIDSTSAAAPPVEELRDLFQHAGCPLLFPGLRQAHTSELHDGETVFPIYRSSRKVVEKELRHTALHHQTALLILRCVVFAFALHWLLDDGGPSACHMPPVISILSH